MNLGAAAGLIWPFALVLTRVSGLVVTVPFIGANVVPIRARLALTLALSFALTLATPYVAAPSAPIIALVGELLLGAVAGLVVRVGVGALDLAGEILGLQAGFGFARIADPMLDSPSSIVGETFGLLAGAVFFVIDGHQQVIRALAVSFRNIPAGTVQFEPGWVGLLMDRAATMFGVGLRIAAPVGGTLLATQLGFALLGRVAPQLNLWGLGFVLTIGITLVSLAIFAPTLAVEIPALLDSAIRDGALIFGR